MTLRPRTRINSAVFWETAVFTTSGRKPLVVPPGSGEDLAASRTRPSRHSISDEQEEHEPRCCYHQTRRLEASPKCHEDHQQRWQQAEKQNPEQITNPLVPPPILLVVVVHGSIKAQECSKDCNLGSG